ncbi:MAG: family 4 glycosyl hydrolase [Acidimicrobiales bacterium]
MTSIAIVGAGSLVFTRTLVNDLLHQEATVDAEIHLVDIDERRLRNAHEVVEGLMVAANRRVAVKATTNCAEGVRDCRYVINTIQVGGRKATELDFDLPEKYGVRQTIADTHGIGGISRALRTVPQVLEIARIVAEHSPDAWFLNYTNPMAMVVMALARESMPRHIGLCHGTEHTVLDIANYLGLEDSKRLAWRAAGINHMTWFLSLMVDGVDRYPDLRRFAVEADVSRHEDGIRLELLRRFGYFVSESSVHNAEYYPWFLRKGAEQEMHGVRVREYLYRLEDLEREFDEARADPSAGGQSVKQVQQSSEYAPRVIAALEGGAPFHFMGNVANTERMIANLPDDSCVEVPCFVHGGSITPGAVGRLPEQCAALNRTAINVQLLTISGILEHRREAIYQAAFLDPLLSAQLTLDEIAALVDELVEAHGNPSDLD